MRYALALLVSILALPAFAEQNVPQPEVFALKALANVARCTPHPEYQGVMACKDTAPGPEVIQVTLNECDDTNFYGKNCGGSWTKTVAIDNVSYEFLILVSRFDETPDFKYIVSLRIFKQGVEDVDASATLYLKDGTLPYKSHAGGARTPAEKNSAGEVVSYHPSIEIGEGAKLGL